MPTYPAIKESHLEALCVALCDSGGGLTGGELGRLLLRCQIEDCNPRGTKRWRLFGALKTRQQTDACANNVLAFIQAALDPAIYAGTPDRHRQLLESVNRSLAFAGFRVSPEGQLASASPARTITEAENRASSLTAELSRRGVHPAVLRSCRAELLADDYFHVILEASKSVASALRDKLNLSLDGQDLVDSCFGTQDGRLNPRIAINSLTSQTDRSEHWGLAALIKGTFSFYRNPTAHEPRLKRKVEEQEAMDMLTLVSFLHREIEKAVLIPTGLNHGGEQGGTARWRLS